MTNIVTKRTVCNPFEDKDDADRRMMKYSKSIAEREREREVSDSYISIDIESMSIVMLTT